VWSLRPFGSKLHYINERSVIWRVPILNLRVHLIINTFRFTNIQLCMGCQLLMGSGLQNTFLLMILVDIFCCYIVATINGRVSSSNKTINTGDR